MAQRQQTVHVIDDDEGVRVSIRRLLQSAGIAVELFSSGEEFLETVPEGAAGCIILDIQLPGLDGLSLQQALSERGIALPIVFITGYGDIPMSVAAMRQGAEDFLAKPFKPDDLLAAIGRAFERDRTIRSDDEERQAILDRIGQLTPREREVFLLVVVGKLNKQIAGELGITEKTVKVHRGRVMEKMEVDSLAELVRLTHVAGILS